MRCVRRRPGTGTHALFTARCRRLGRVRGSFGQVGGCGMSIGRISGEIVFLHGLRHNNDRRSFNVRMTGVTNVPGDVIGHTGRVLGRLRSSGHRRNVSNGPLNRMDRGEKKVRLDFFRLSSPVLYRVESRVLGLSIGGLAPVRTLGGLDSVGGVIEKEWSLVSFTFGDYPVSCV